MRPSPPLHPHRIALLSLCLSPALLAQAPPNAPLPTSPGASAAPAPASRPQRADVTFTDGLLTVSANDASLNRIVREIARQTGMHLSGSVADLPVFGTYGPDTPSTILSILLDGTGTNMLLVEATATSPAQLTRTRRSGGATPPNPNAAQEADSNTDPFGRPQQPAQAASPAPAASQPPSQGVNNTQPTSTVQPIVFPTVGTTSTPATGTTTPADPDQPSTNGVKTPQQIFEQLQRLRQQQTHTNGNQ